jgi:S1-C subfamily serine protease
MAIRILCSCGREALAEEALAGRWIRCAACGKPVQVRRSRIEPGAAKPPGPIPPPVPMAVPIPERPSGIGLSLPKIPHRSWGAKLAAHRGLLLFLAINLAILAGAGIYASRRGAGMVDRPEVPNGSDVPGSIPNAGGDRLIRAKGGDAALSTREIVARSESSVAQIKGRFGSGSGFMVGPGLLATNAHVVAKEIPADLRVFFPSRDDVQKGPYRAALVYEDPPRDLALLKIEVPFPPLPLASPYQFRRGEDVTMIGSPGVVEFKTTLENAVSRGVLSTETVLDGLKFYQLGASVNHGNSGGPALDSKGNVVGVVTLLTVLEESISFCVPVDDLAQAISRARAYTPNDIHQLADRHSARAVFQNVAKTRGSLCVVLLAGRSKRITDALEGRAETIEQAAAITKGQEALGRINTSFDDGYRVAVSDLLFDPALPADLRRDIRDLWETCDDMSRLALDPRPNLGQFSGEAAALVNRYFALLERLKRDHDLALD